MRRPCSAHPDPVLSGRGFVALEYLNARLVALDERRLQQLLVEKIDDRDHTVTELDDPARQCNTVDRHQQLS